MSIACTNGTPAFKMLANCVQNTASVFLGILADPIEMSSEDFRRHLGEVEQKQRFGTQREQHGFAVRRLDDSFHGVAGPVGRLI